MGMVSFEAGLRLEVRVAAALGLRITGMEPLLSLLCSAEADDLGIAVVWEESELLLLLLFRGALALGCDLGDSPLDPVASALSASRVFDVEVLGAFPAAGMTSSRKIVNVFLDVAGQAVRILIERLYDVLKCVVQCFRQGRVVSLIDAKPAIWLPCKTSEAPSF